MNIKKSPYNRRMKTYNAFLYYWGWEIGRGTPDSIARVLAWQHAFRGYRENRNPITGRVEIK
jgi:hypothetical protein